MRKLLGCKPFGEAVSARFVGLRSHRLALQSWAGALSYALFALYLLSMPIYCLIRLTGQVTLIGLSTALTAISLFAFSLVHCLETRSARRALAMLASAFTITLAMEYLGSAHGILFGHYEYSGNLGPKALGQVPIIIPIAWFMMLYPAWCIADLLVTEYAIRHTRNAPRVAYHAARIVIAALAMTAWDLSLDPRMVADGNWIWRDGGAYFGIPLSNYLGWFVTSALIYSVWTRIRIENVRLRIEKTNSSFSIFNSQSLPVWAYVVTWIGESVANALFWGGPDVAAFVFVGMGIFGAPALWFLVRRQRNQQEANTRGLASL